MFMFLDDLVYDYIGTDKYAKSITAHSEGTSYTCRVLDYRKFIGGRYLFCHLLHSIRLNLFSGKRNYFVIILQYWVMSVSV